MFVTRWWRRRRDRQTLFVLTCVAALGEATRLQVIQVTGLYSAVNILARLAQEGLMTAERSTPMVPGRELPAGPPQLCYQLTVRGVEYVHALATKLSRYGR